MTDAEGVTAGGARTRLVLAALMAFSLGVSGLLLAAVVGQPDPRNPEGIAVASFLTTLLVPISGLVLAPSSARRALFVAVAGYIGTLAGQWGFLNLRGQYPEPPLRSVFFAVRWAVASPIGIAVLWGLVYLASRIGRRSSSKG